jgi:hypothetical protein
MKTHRLVPVLTALTVLLAAVLFLPGCKTTLLVRDATVQEIIPIFKDYAGTHGYQITYENPQTGSFRLSLGNVFVSGRSETTKTKFVTVNPPAEGSNQPLTAYEDTTWRTVSTPGRYVEATAAVNMVQQDNDVIINIDTNDVAASSLDDLLDYIRGLGYEIDRK